MGFVRKVANRVIFMDRGSIVEDCPRKGSSATAACPDRAQQFLSKILQH